MTTTTDTPDAPTPPPLPASADPLDLARNCLARWRALADIEDRLPRAAIRDQQEGLTSIAMASALTSIAESLELALLVRPVPPEPALSTPVAAAMTVVRPGDRLLLNYEGHLNPDESELVLAEMRERYPDVGVTLVFGASVVAAPPVDLSRLTEVGDDPEQLGAAYRSPLVNVAESADDAARRLAGELNRLLDGLAARDIAPAPDCPMDTAPVDTALAALDLLRFATAGRFGALDLPQDPSTMHVIEFREDGWTIMHPLACRPNLFECPVNRAAERDLVRAPDALGRFECGVFDHGRATFWIGDRVGVEPVDSPITHASPGCACGTNDAGQQYVDPICRPTTAQPAP